MDPFGTQADVLCKQESAKLASDTLRDSEDSEVLGSGRPQGRTREG